MIVVGCSNSKSLAKIIARKAGLKYSDLVMKHFPDGELYIKYAIDIKNEDVFLVQTLYPSTEAILEILIAGYTAKDLGAKKVNLIAPYMAYMRQDKRFFKGEAISSLIIGKMFNIFDKIITIDPHLHRHKSLNEVFYNQNVLLSSNKLIEDYLQKNYSDSYIIGPDEESNQWAEEIAKKIGMKSIVFNKKRYNSQKVKVYGKGLEEIKNQKVIIIDDIISTGHTILESINEIKKYKPKTIIVVGIHGIFANKLVYEQIMKNTKEIITTNTIETKHSKIDVSELISNSLL